MRRDSMRNLKEPRQKKNGAANITRIITKK